MSLRAKKRRRWARYCARAARAALNPWPKESYQRLVRFFEMRRAAATRPEIVARQDGS